MVTATSTDGNAYVWGVDRRVLIRNWVPTTDASVGNNDVNGSSTIDNHLMSPQRLDDPAFNGKVKGFYNSNDLFAIHTTDGEVYTFGHNADDLQNEPSASFSRYLIKTRPLEMPSNASPGATVVDFKLAKKTYYIITSDGKTYWRGDDLGGVDASNGWKEIAAPAGPAVPANFEYTEFLNKSKTTNNQIFMKGSNNRIYAAGSSREQLFGSNYNSGSTNPTQSSGIVEIEFPAGVAEKVIRIKDQTFHIAAITSDGEIYAWGSYSRNNGDLLAFKLDPSAPVPTFFTQTGGKQFIKTPTKIALPAGETSLLDIDFDEGSNFDNPTIVVGGSGTSYIIGGDDANQYILAENREPFMDYTPLWSAERVVAKEVYIVGDIVAYLDGAGQYLHHGDIFESGGISTLNGSTAQHSPIAIPITDGTKDSTNPNPQ